MIIKILYGLPGSGKTTYAKSQKNAKVIDCDTLRGGYTAEKAANKIRATPRNHCGQIVVDGLFTKRQQVLELIKAIEKKNKNLVFELHCWKKNVEACLANDNKRSPSRQAAASIKKLAKGYQVPKKGIPATIVYHNVVCDQDYITWWGKWIHEPYRDHDPRFLRSETWSLGGECRSYTGHSWAREADPRPLGFAELESLLEQIAPKITFLEYKKIERECVRETSRDASDYYFSGSEGYYECDLTKLERILKDMGHLTSA